MPSEIPTGNERLVIIEYGARDQPALIFGELLDCFGEEGVVVVDVANTGLVMKKHLEALTDYKRSASPKVIKIGGAVEWGDTIAILDVYNEPVVFLRKLDEILKERSKEIDAVLYFGIERLPRFHTDPPRIILAIAHRAILELSSPYVPIYFINEDVSPPELKALLEEAADTVVVLKGENVKSVKTKSPQTDSFGAQPGPSG